MKGLKQILCVGSMILFYSCENKNDLTIGTNFISTDTHVVSVDTTTIKMSTFKIDSIQTSGKSVALVGYYSDNQMGGVKSRSYIKLSTSTTTLAENAVYDSLVLKLYPSGYYYGDTTHVFNLKVNRVTEDIVFPNDANGFFSNTNFKYDETPLGEVTFNSRPKEKKEISIPFSNDLGNDFVNILKSRKNAFDEYGGFANYFKGIVLSSTDDVNQILGFSMGDSTISLNLYYHLEGSAYTDTLSINFKPSSTSYQFNQIENVNTNSLISKLTSKPIQSELLDNNAYVQGGTGITTRIDFPWIKNYLLDGKKFELIKAMLYIQPTIDSNPDYLPATLNLYATNKFNEFQTVLTDKSGTKLSGSLTKDLVYPENTCYSWDVTNFINTLMDVEELNYNGLLLLPTSYDSKIDHIVAANQIKSQYRTHLKLYILYYE